MSQPDLGAVERAARGLLLPSESDEPIDMVRWDDGAAELDDGAVLRLAGREPGTRLDRTDLADVFRDAFRGPDADRFRELARAIEAAVDSVRVYRLGDVEKDVYVVGRTRGGGGWAGIRSRVVES